eukprot:TRINITY_DN4163_c0_g1_i1.p1 TRINITY_DN4163_c0_g1~~TRINITY_DN4163_c0_g1_i1.p1  ORF type:complete len:120 (+),score=44.23 TRINITY_DN4163_c0_g1_i1:215-574(+)
MYTGYVALQKEFPGKFEIIAFPCNQFGGQEPGTEPEIKAFAGKYGFTQYLTQKVEVNGDNAHPLWKWLKDSLPGVMGTTSIKWNFSKFLIDKDGKPVQRYSPTDKVDTFRGKLKELIES